MHMITYGTVKANRNAHAKHCENPKEEETSMVCTPQRILHRRREGVSTMVWLLPDSKMKDGSLHKGNKTSKVWKHRKLGNAGWLSICFVIFGGKG